MAARIPELAMIVSIIMLGQRFSGYENKLLGYVILVFGVIAAILWLHSVYSHPADKKGARPRVGKLKLAATYITALVLLGFVLYPWIVSITTKKTATSAAAPTLPTATQKILPSPTAESAATSNTSNRTEQPQITQGKATLLHAEGQITEAHLNNDAIIGQPAPGSEITGIHLGPNSKVGKLEMSGTRLDLDPKHNAAIQHQARLQMWRNLLLQAARGQCAQPCSVDKIRQEIKTQSGYPSFNNEISDAERNTIFEQEADDYTTVLSRVESAISRISEDWKKEHGR